MATARRWVAEAGLDEAAREQAAALLVKLYRCYTEGDCDLAEVNPLILTPDGTVHALDAKVTLDENASFRHPEWEEYRATETEDPREKMAKERGLNYIGLDGSVGIIANGAGLAMSTLDVVNQVGGHGGQLPRHRRRRERRRHGVRARGDQHRPQGARPIFVNIFGGITRVDEVASGVLEALGRVDDRLADRAAPRRHQRRGRARDTSPRT